MTANTPDSERRVLPRWRTAAAAVASGELRVRSAQKATDTARQADRDFDQLLSDWSTTRSLEAASEIVSSAFVLGRNDEAYDQARLILDSTTEVKPAVVVVAGTVARGGAAEESDAAQPSAEPNRIDPTATISTIRKRLNTYPRNPLMWMDLAHAQTELGNIARARRSVAVALTLAPENRFVLRSAARFYVHAEAVDQGLYLLRRSRAICSDPWVMAAEIALSEVAGKSPAAYRAGRILSEEDRLLPWDTAELNSALGTLALSDSKGSKVRRLFVNSLRAPTENAIAQAQWASSIHGAVSVPAELLRHGEPFEAIAWRARFENKWEEVLEACRRWSVMDPTSTRPLALGAFVAEVALNDGGRAEFFTRRALTLTPHHPIALNNHAVALAYQGRLVEAAAMIDRASRRPAELQSRVTLQATRGLILYREGKRDDGLEQYLHAADVAAGAGDKPLQAMVYWHLLREEAVAGASDLEPLVERLWKITRGMKVPEISAVRKTVLEQAARMSKKRNAADSNSQSQLAHRTNVTKALEQLDE